MCTMQQTLVLIVTSVLLVKSGFGCTPCKCYISTEYPWKNLQLAECKKELKLTSIPATLRQDIQALSFEWQTLSGIKANQFSKYDKLQIIYLRNNKMKYVERHALKNLTNLKDFSLSENDITELPTDLFQDTPNLNEFWINNNNITILQKNLFSNLKFLKRANFYKSNVMIIEDGCFSNLPALEVLELSNNKLKTIQLNTDNDLVNLKTVYIGGNPWKCEETCQFINTFIKRNLQTDTNQPTCDSPRQAKGKQWKQLSLQDFAPSVILTTSIEESQTNVILQCTHCLTTNFSWFVNDTNQIWNHPLIIYSVTSRSSGKYTCRVRSCDGCDTASVILNVADPIPISIQNVPQLTTTETVIISTQKTAELTENSTKASDLNCICEDWTLIIILILTAVFIIVVITIITFYCKKKNTKRLLDHEEEQNRKL